VNLLAAGVAQSSVPATSPRSALGAALLPTTVAIADGQKVSAGLLAGVPLCLVSVTLVSLEGRPPGAAGRRLAVSGVACGLAAGVAFGLYFLCIRNIAAAADCGRWPSRGAPRPRSR
jgi:drug/metabolite transporter (DMT)-like permease